MIESTRPRPEQLQSCEVGSDFNGRLVSLVNKVAPTRPGNSESSAEASWQDFTKVRATFESQPKANYCCFAAGYRQLAKFGLISWQPNCQTQLTVKTPAEKCLLWLPVKGRVCFRCPGDAQSQLVEAGLASVMPAIAATRCQLDASSLILALVIPQKALIEGIEALVGQPLIGRVVFERTVVPSGNGVGRLIREVLEFIVDLMSSLSSPDFSYTTSVLSSRLEEAIVLSMLSGIPHSFTNVLVSQESGAAPGMVRRSELYIHAHAAEALTIGDIAGAVGYSARSIQLAFRRFRNTTPMAYLRRVRLEHAYEELLHARPATTIASVASHWHFSHHGRFSVEFRRRYGETPGEVLHRGHRR